jgi:hypothetical protein
MHSRELNKNWSWERKKFILKMPYNTCYTTNEKMQERQSDKWQ